MEVNAIKSYVKNKLRPYSKGPLRDLYCRITGLSPSRITHKDIAALVGKPNPTILEIGCNNGDDTIAMLEAMPGANIYCFEPDPRAASRFRTQLGPKLDQVKLFEIAISDRNGTIDFHTSTGGALPEGWDQSGSIRRPKNHLVEYPWVTFGKTIPVKTQRLDDWRRETGVEDIDFIWMDVQGAEGDVIAGAAETLSRTRYLFTEYNNRELYEGQPSLKELIAMLPGFNVVSIYPGDVMLKNRAYGK